MKKLTNIQTELQALAPHFHALLNKKADEKDGFQVPNHYFEQLSERMQAIPQSEVDDFVFAKNTTAALQKKSFALPTAYFEQFEQKLYAQIETENQAENYDFPAPKFGLPDGYFANFESRLSERIQAEETADSTAFLESLTPKEEKAFSLPADYFAKFENRLTKKLAPDSTQETKVIPMPPAAAPSERMEGVPTASPDKKEFNIRTILRPLSGVAASLAVFFVVSYMFMAAPNSKPSSVFNLENAFAEISEQELNSFMQLNGSDFDESYLADQLGDVNLFTLSNNIDLDFLDNYILEQVDDYLINEIL